MWCRLMPHELLDLLEHIPLALCLPTLLIPLTSNPLKSADETYRRRRRTP